MRKLSNCFLSILPTPRLSLKQLNLYSGKLSHLKLSFFFEINYSTLFLVFIVPDCTLSLLAKNIIVFTWQYLTISNIISNLFSAFKLLLIKLFKTIVDLFRNNFLFYEAIWSPLEQILFGLYFHFAALTSLRTINCLLSFNSALNLVSIHLILFFSFVLNLLNHFMIFELFKCYFCLTITFLFFDFEYRYPSSHQINLSISIFELLYCLEIAIERSITYHSVFLFFWWLFA
jgi:hypothetical protein